MITLDDVRGAADRIRHVVRRTPVILADQMLASPMFGGASLGLKLECLQVTGSFKARGAMNQLMTLPPEALARGVVTASDGNHGVAVARAAHLAGVTATVFLPEGASPAKKAKIVE